MKDKIKEKDLYHLVVVAQIVFTSIILGLMCFLSATSEGLKKDFKSFLDWDMSETLYTVVSSFKDYLGTNTAWTVNSGSVTVTGETREQASESESELSLQSDISGEEHSDTVESAANEALSSSVPYAIGGEEVSIYEAADNASFAPIKSTAKILCPIENPRYTSYFGYRISPITSKWAFHTGLDIAAAEGTKIRAAFSGTVTKTGEDSVAGKYIFLTHSDGFVTFYCHCSEIVAEQGANIRQGETIAKVGSTGNSTGPHLHFEVRKDGIRYNPLHLLEDDS